MEVNRPFSNWKFLLAGKLYVLRLVYTLIVKCFAYSDRRQNLCFSGCQHRPRLQDAWSPVSCSAAMHGCSPSLTGTVMVWQTTMGDEFNDPLFQRALMDVHMMVCLNGHERTVPEW